MFLVALRKNEIKKEGFSNKAYIEGDLSSSLIDLRIELSFWIL